MEKKDLYIWRKRVGNQFDTLKDIIAENPDPIQKLQITQDICVATAESFGRSMAEKISTLELAKLILFNHHEPKVKQISRDNAMRDRKFIDEAEEELR